MAVVPNALLIIDGNFLKHVFWGQFPDVEKLIGFIETQAPEGEKFTFQSFYMDAPVSDAKKASLKRLGIQVPELKTKTMDVKCSKCGNIEVRPIQADVDIEIATTLLEYGILPTIRYIILVSGDGDFSRVVTKVVSAPGAKKLFILFGRLGMTSKDLVAVAGPNFIDLKKKNEELGFMDAAPKSKPKDDAGYTKVEKKKPKVKKEKVGKDSSGYVVKDGVIVKVSDDDQHLDAYESEDVVLSGKVKTPKDSVKVKPGVVVKVSDSVAIKDGKMSDGSASKQSVEDAPSSALSDLKDLRLSAEEKAFLEAEMKELMAAQQKDITVTVVLPSLKRFKLKLKDSMSLWDVHVLLGSTYPELAEVAFLFGNDSILFRDDDLDLKVRDCLSDNQTIWVKKM